MKEKKKTPQESQLGAGGGGSIFDGAPAIENKNVTVSSGPYSEDLPVAGMTVGGIRQKFSDRLDINAKAQGIINGNAVDDTVVLKPGEALMFIQHAGEKGALVTIEGTKAHTNSGANSMPLDKLLDRMAQPISTGPVVLPYGVKAVLSSGPVTVWVWERPPCIQKLSWICSDSPVPYGPGTQYRDVSIALPYLVIMAVFQRNSSGIPVLVKTDECFFRNSPMTSLDDQLMYPALLNCSKFKTQEGNPLSWICTQYLKGSKDMQSKDANVRFRAGFEAVRYCLLETSFNLSSEHHEGNSWFGQSKKDIPQVNTIERWESETKKDPTFAVDVPWLPTNHSVRQVVDRIFKRCGAEHKGIKSSDDVARLILNS